MKVDIWLVGVSKSDMCIPFMSQELIGVLDETNVLVPDYWNDATRAHCTANQNLLYSGCTSPYRTLLLTLCFKDLYSINVPPSQLADGPVLQASSVFRLAVSSGIYLIRLNGFSLLSTNMVSNWFEPLPCFASFLIH